MGCFLGLPPELRNAIYNVVYYVHNPWIFLESVYKDRTRQDILRRYISPNLRGSISFNFSCKTVHVETKDQLSRVLRSARFCIPLLTNANQHVFEAFCDSVTGRLTRERLSSDISTPLKYCFIAPPPSPLKLLTIYLDMYSSYRSVLHKISTTFLRLEYLCIHIRAPLVRGTKFQWYRSPLGQDESAADFYRRGQAPAALLRELQSHASILGGFDCFKISKGRKLLLSRAKLSYRLSVGTEEWLLNFTKPKHRIADIARPLPVPFWRLVDIEEVGTGETVTWDRIYD